MSYRKYAGDYRLENVLGENGKLKTQAVYRGDWYHFSIDAQAVKRLKVFYSVLCAISVVLLLTLLLCSQVMGKSWFAVVPVVGLTIPMLFVAMGVWRLDTAKERFTREHNDKIKNRLSPASMFQTVIAVLETAGCIAQMILDGYSVERLLYTVGAALIALAGVAMFVLRKRILTEMLPKKEAKKS